MYVARNSNNRRHQYQQTNGESWSIKTNQEQKENVNSVNIGR